MLTINEKMLREDVSDFIDSIVDLKPDGKSPLEDQSNASALKNLIVAQCALLPTACNSVQIICESNESGTTRHCNLQVIGQTMFRKK